MVGNRKGIALPLALFALVIVGALVAASFVVGRHDRLGSTTTNLSASAQNAAESGLANMYASWDPTIHSILTVWNGTAATEWASGWQTVGGNSRLRYVDSLRRLNTSLFLVRSTGQRLDAGNNVVGQVQLAQYYRLFKPTISVNAAITVQDPVTFNGNSFYVGGINSNPPQWASGECSALDSGTSDDVVGVRSSVGTGVTAADYNNIDGFPSEDSPNDPTITSATFQNFLDYTYSTLASQANVVTLTDANAYNNVGPILDATTSPTSCKKTPGSWTKNDPVNLGEPYRLPNIAIPPVINRCYGHFPVVHGTASETAFAANSRGQGTLLIDGDLKLTGGFEWTGLIIIRGKMKITGSGNKIVGAILAEGVDLTTSGTVGGNVEVRYSKCAIEKAVGGASLARPLGQRGWAQLY